MYGLLLCFYGPPAKLFDDNAAQTAAIVGEVLKGVFRSGGAQRLFPIINRSIAETRGGILGAVDCCGISGNYITRRAAGDSWAFLHVSCDSEATNSQTIRYISADTMRCPRLLVSFIPRLDHSLSPVAKMGICEKVRLRRIPTLARKNCLNGPDVTYY